MKEYALDLPDPASLTGSESVKWVRVKTFKSKGEAIDYIRRRLGGNSVGDIGALTEVTHDNTTS